MAIQDDIDKTIAYARSLGISIYILPQSINNDRDAEFCFVNKRIKVWRYSRTSKHSTLCSLLHELGHAKSYLEDPKYFSETHRVLNLTHPTRADRFHVYERERLDVARMVEIHQQLKLGISLDYVRASRDYDIWQYWFWWKVGRFPEFAEGEAKKTEVLKQYGVRVKLA